MHTSTTTPPGAGTPAPSTRPAAPDRLEGTLQASSGQITRLITLGDVVLVKLDEGVRRPMIVSVVAQLPIYDRIHATVENPTAASTGKELRLSGTIFCEPEDQTLPALRSGVDRPNDPARIHGRPDRYHPIVYGEALRPGSGIGEWITRPTNLPAGR